MPERIYNAQNTGDLPAIVALDKSSSDTSLIVPGYQLLDPTTIEYNPGTSSSGITVARTGSVASGTVTLTTTLPGVTGSSAETWGFNGDGLVTSDTTSLTEPDGTASSATTSYQYDTSRSRTTVNDAAIWGEVSKITFPDSSTESFTYTTDTGWLATETTPFKNTADATKQTFGYADASGTGDLADTTQLVERPRQITTTVNNITTGITFNQFHNATASFVTRNALALAPTPTPSPTPAPTPTPTWANSGMQSTTRITGYDSHTVQSPTGDVTFTGSPTTFSTSTDFFGHPTSSSSGTLNAFGQMTASSNTSLGSALTGISGTPSTDALGRLLSSTAVGGATENLSNYSWQGPQTVTAPDGTVTTYTYTPWGAINTETTGSLAIAFAYDAAGNVVSTTDTGTPATGSPISTSTSEDWDAQGRPTKYVDAMSRATTYTYVPSSSGMTDTTTYSDGTTEIDAYNLDGTLASVSGTAVTANPTPTPTPSPTPTPTPSSTTAMSYDEGVNSDGDTWVKAVVGGSLSGTNWTQTFTNIQGEQYQTQTSTDEGTATDTTTFDNNGRPVTDTGYNGAVTHIEYNPLNGTIADTWLDVAGKRDSSGNPVYAPGFDPKTLYSYTDPSNAGGTTKTTDLSTTGDTADAVTVSNGGLTTSETVGVPGSNGTINGLTTTDQISFPTTGGGETDTTTNPDGTKLTDSYTQGLLSSAVTLGAGGVAVTSESYGYNALQQNNSVTDWTGTTIYSLRADGSISGETLPDGRTSGVTATDPATDAPTATTRTDGTTINAAYNTLGEQTSQSGAGVVPATFGYDQTTGNLNGITTFASGTVGSGAASTTGYEYSQYTGLPTTTTYNDESTQTLHYNAKMQVDNITDKDGGGNTTMGGVLNYDAVGNLNSASYNDDLLGENVADAVKNIDDKGRAGITSETAPNPASPTGAPMTTASTEQYTAQDQLQSDKSGPSGATTVYAYYPTNGTGSTGNGASPGALESVKLVSAGATISETDYAYDQTSGRMNKVTIVGENGASNQVFNVNYKPNTNLISGVTAPGSSTSFQYDSQNGRLTHLTAAKATGGNVYDGGYSYYTDDQRNTDTVTRTNADGSQDSYAATYTYDTQDQLHTVSSTGTGAPDAATITYDGAGNRTGYQGPHNSGPFAGGVNTNGMNQYNSDVYNARGDCTKDGYWNYTYNALDELTSANNYTIKVTFGYDAESRLTETDTWVPNGSGGWTLTGTTRNAWDGSNLLAQFDGSNKLLRSFAWGPTGLLGITDYTSGIPVTYIPIKDATGSIVELLDTSGNVVADYHYDAWGNRTAAGPAAGACPFGFAGMLKDPTTGLYIDDERDYDAPQGRFLQPDPSGQAGGLNLYAYCNNDPVNNVDPTGQGPIAAAANWGADHQMQFSPLYWMAAPFHWLGDKLEQAGEFVANNGSGSNWNVAGGTLAYYASTGNHFIGGVLNPAPGLANLGESSAQVGRQTTAKSGSVILGTAEGTRYFIHSLVGAQQIGEFVVGKDELSGYTINRTSLNGGARLASGTSALSFSAAGGLGLARVNPTVFGRPGANIVAVPGGYQLELPVKAPAGSAAESGVTAQPYGELSGNLPKGFQANHLNQNAVYKGVIPPDEGLGTSMRGNAFTEPGTPHYNFHQSMEGFWNQYRPNGNFFGLRPTNAQYGQALQQALRAGGYSPAQASSLAAQAEAQRAAAGLAETALVPRIPGRINQVQP